MIAFAHELRGDALALRWPEHRVGAPTRRSCEAASRFGLLLDEHVAHPPRKDVSIPAKAGTITLFTGPSGAGKSTLLRDAGRALRERGVRILRLDEVALNARPSVDLLGGTVDDALRALARVGLGQADCFLKRPNELSDGQRWRLRLALALERLAHHEGETALLIDECCAILDPCSALGACATLRRAVRRTPGLRVLCASADPRLLDTLAPDTIVRTSPGGLTRVEKRSANTEHTAPLTIESGSARECAALLALHYRQGRPARPALTLVARLREPARFGHDAAPVGALIVSYPTLNSAVRERAWPGRYTTTDRAENARRLNGEVRTLARAVVDPRLRGVGVATELVRAYLRAPLTARTEGVGAMSSVTDFLATAGMTRHELPIRAPDARLLDALAHAGVEAWRLSQGRVALARALEGSSGAFLERELRTWARAGRAHTRLSSAPLGELFLRACRFAGCRPVGYTHEQE